jgi:heme/copper-type cytochrome/quinol oxidase subunit 2
MKSVRHLTTRRDFIAAAGFSVVSLYGLWAAFDAAPLGFGGGHKDDATEPTVQPGAAEHAGHGAAVTGPTPEEFRNATEAFIARFQQPDGSVRPTLASAPDAHGSHGSHASHGAAAATPTAEIKPVDVYLMAFRWGFEPSLLRLDAQVPYRFRMMAVDVSHGASLQLGAASRIIRLRRGVQVEQPITFTRPGPVLVYCTVFCGPPHDRMAAKIVVA